MSRLPKFSWIPALGGIVAIGAAILGQTGISVLGLIGAVVGVVLVGLSLGRTQRSSNPLDQVSNDNRSRLLPVTRLQREIDELVLKHKKDPLVASMGAEAQRDAAHLVEQAVHLLGIRESLSKAMRSSATASQREADIRSRIESAQSDEERAALETAIQAHQLEAQHGSQAKDAIESIDANLVQAAAILSELRTRLHLAATHSSEFEQEDMRETLSQLKALSASFDEAEEVMRGSI